MFMVSEYSWGKARTEKWLESERGRTRFQLGHYGCSCLRSCGGGTTFFLVAAMLLLNLSLAVSNLLVREEMGIEVHQKQRSCRSASQ